MSAVRNVQLDFLSKRNEDFFVSEDSDDAFDFKYVSKSQFKSIIRDVRRQRMREREERNWASFPQDEDSDGSDLSQEEDSDYPKTSNIKKLMRESIKGADQELRRLQKDVLPEGKKSTSKGHPSVAKISTTKEDSPNEIHRPKDSADSAKMLLTIPEEINACERSPISRLECSARKSHSAGVLRSRIDSPNAFHRANNDYDIDYSSGSADHFDSDDDCIEKDGYQVRPHPEVAHKILGIQRKISDLLDEISLRLNRIPLPDGDSDLRRRQQRVAEFAIRFSRNYLYDLGRQIAAVNRHVRAIEPNARMKPARRVASLHMQAIEQKLTTAHHLLLNALSAYCKHVPSSVLKGEPGKLKEILQVVMELREICVKIHLTSDRYGCGDAEAAPLGEDTEKRCSAMLAKLRFCDVDNESRVVSRTAQSSPIGKRGGVNGTDNCRNLPSRLAMYSSETRLSRPIGSRKLAPPRSRERRARRDSIARAASSRRPSTPEQPNASPAIGKLSREDGKRGKRRICLPLREDEISTMMSTLATDSDAASSVSASGSTQRRVSIRGASDSAKCSRKQPSEHSKGLNGPINAAPVADDDQRVEGEKRITDRELSSLVPVIADLMTLVTNQANEVDIRSVPSESMEALMELLKKYRNSDPQNTINGETNFDQRSSSEAKNVKNSRRSMRNMGETYRGEKNVQLICLTAEENDASESRGEKADGAIAATMRSRENGGLRVNESSVKSLIKYREDYEHFTRSNPMYTSNSQNKPWEVVSWIADKLVNELIDDVSEEFEIKDAINELFALEFKEFKLS